MDIILASSMGRGYIQARFKRLHPHPEKLYIDASGDEKLEVHILKAIRLVKRPPTPSECHIHFKAGLYDITHRDIYAGFVDYMTLRVHSYEQVSFTEDNTGEILRVTNLIDNMDKELKSLGAKPCFMTIPPAA